MFGARGEGNGWNTNFCASIKEPRKVGRDKGEIDRHEEVGAGTDNPLQNKILKTEAT